MRRASLTATTRHTDASGSRIGVNVPSPGYRPTSCLRPRWDNRLIRDPRDLRVRGLPLAVSLRPDMGHAHHAQVMLAIQRPAQVHDAAGHRGVVPYLVH